MWLLLFSVFAPRLPRQTSSTSCRIDRVKQPSGKIMLFLWTGDVAAPDSPEGHESSHLKDRLTIWRRHFSLFSPPLSSAHSWTDSPMCLSCEREALSKTRPHTKWPLIAPDANPSEQHTHMHLLSVTLETQWEVPAKRAAFVPARAPLLLYRDLRRYETARPPPFPPQSQRHGHANMALQR